MTLFIFFTKVFVCSAVFFGYYFFFLRNKQFHQYNRYYLLIGAALSFLLPLVHIPVLLTGQESNHVLIKTLNVITVSSWEDEFVVTPHKSMLFVLLTFKNVALAIYLTGFVILTAHVVKSILYIKKLSRTYRAEQIDTVTFYNTREPGTPFSFFNAVFWNERILISSEKGQQILRHEIFHIRAKHSYDILFMKAVTIVFWFNPFCYLFMKELKAIHEFSADEYASSTADRYDYAELLVTEAINNKKAFLSNQFFHNQIKRRINMLIKHNTSGFSYLRRIMALPLLLILFCAFALKCSKKQTDTVSHLNKMQKSKTDTLPASEVLKNIKGEMIKEMNINNDIIFVRLKNGDSLIMKTNDYMAVNAKKAVDIVADQNMTFTKLETGAAFPGGPKEWMYYLNKNFRYPMEAQNEGIQGTVIVQFIVDKEGNVSDIKALIGPEIGGLKEESIRIIKNSGKWIPAKQNGIAVKSYKKQPITFKLEAE